jgi:hypothetical protein
MTGAGRRVGLDHNSQALRSRGRAAMIERTMDVYGSAEAAQLDASTYAQEPQ